MAEDGTHDTHRFEREGNLDESIREAIAEAKGERAADVDNPLYDDVNPDGLDNLLWEDARPRTSVELTTNAVAVKLWGDGSVEIDVLDEDAET